MFTAIYTERDGKADLDILATRGEDITEATRDVAAQSPTPGGVRLLTLTKAGALLEAAQRRITALATDNPAARPDWSAHKDDELGFVRVTWID